MHQDSQWILSIREKKGHRMNKKVYEIRAFVSESGGGNPAGVVPDAEGLTDEAMQAIAKRVGFSETAFVLPSTRADFKVRFFTPTEEVALCGHATIGTFSAMAQLKKILPGSYTQETQAGVLETRVYDDGTVLMDQVRPIYGEPIDGATEMRVAASLSLASPCKIGPYKMEIVSTGLRDLMVPVESLEEIAPNAEAISVLSDALDVTGYHVFEVPETLQAVQSHPEFWTVPDVFCRNFAPLYGIPEESATGTSNGALACYLYQNGLKDDVKTGTVRMTFRQGLQMGSPSKIEAELVVSEGEILSVKVGGKTGIPKLSGVYAHD
jgi:PhzF family phenazine biosynthesis protein